MKRSKRCLYLKGFTCGDDTDSTLYDVPCLLESCLREWDSIIHAILQDIFSAPGTNKYKIIQNKHGKEYELLFDIICPDHPEYHTYPLLLICERPMQGDCQSISDYFNAYVNYLKLSAYLTNASINLNDSCKREIFIGNLCEGKEFLDKKYDKRNSNDPTKHAMYQQGNLIGRLESMAKQIHPNCHIPNHRSPAPKKELTFTCQQPNQQKSLPPPSKGAPAKKIQSIDCSPLGYSSGSLHKAPYIFQFPCLVTLHYLFALLYHQQITIDLLFLSHLSTTSQETLLI